MSLRRLLWADIPDWPFWLVLLPFLAYGILQKLGWL